MNALQRQLVRGSTGVSVLMRAQNQISFVPQTSVASGATAGLVLKYYRVGDLAGDPGGTSVALVSFGGPATSMGFSAGGVAAIADGYVRCDIPDAAFANAAGVNSVLITASATAVVFTGCVVQLIDAGSEPQASTPKKF